MKCSIPTFLAIVVAAVVLPGAFGQTVCPNNDGFSGGPCCTPASPTLPNFPTLTLNGLGACIRDCGVESQFNTIATLSPQQVLCDHWLINLTISGPPSVSIGAGNFLVAKYSRTWMEFPIPGTPPLQVWRFLVNGDLNYSLTTAAGIGCPVPLSAAPPFNLPVHYVGHLDYAFNCGTGAWQVAYSLTHWCPPESHAPFSQRPIPAAAGWAKRTYHFVGPANFMFGLCPPPDGTIVAESTRSSVGLSNPAIPYTCQRESQVFQGVLTNLNSNCVCNDPTPVGPPPRYMHQTLNAFEFCGGAGAPIFNFAGFGIPFMPTGLRALMLGSWVPVAGGGTYPGTKCLSVYLGVLESPGVCPPLPAPGGSLHAVTGVGTTGGNAVQLFDSPTPAIAPLKFLDLQNMLVLTPFGFQIGIGSLFASEKVWNFNSF
jgi:hypothetical protein